MSAGPLSAAARLAIHEVLSLHGHLMDAGEHDAHGVQVRSKGLAVNADGSCGSVVYEDLVRRTDSGWRIAYRKVSARRAPLQS